MQWSYGRDPEEDVSFLDLLRGTDRTAAHDSREGSDDARLLQLQLGHFEICLGRCLFGAMPGHFGDGLVEFVLDVFPVLFAADLFRTHDVGATHIRFAAFLFGLPLSDLRVKGGDAGLLRVEGGTQRSIVQ